MFQHAQVTQEHSFLSIPYNQLSFLRFIKPIPFEEFALDNHHIDWEMNQWKQQNSFDEHWLNCENYLYTKTLMCGKMLRTSFLPAQNHPLGPNSSTHSWNRKSMAKRSPHKSPVETIFTHSAPELHGAPLNYKASIKTTIKIQITLATLLPPFFKVKNAFLSFFSFFNLFPLFPAFSVTPNGPPQTPRLHMGHVTDGQPALSAERWARQPQPGQGSEVRSLRRSRCSSVLSFCSFFFCFSVLFFWV